MVDKDGGVKKHPNSFFNNVIKAKVITQNHNNELNEINSKKKEL
jgi:hypothetical protein